MGSERGTLPAGASSPRECTAALEEESVSQSNRGYRKIGWSSLGDPCKCETYYHYKPAGWNNFRCSERGTLPAGASSPRECTAALVSEEQSTLAKVNRALKKAL